MLRFTPIPASNPKSPGRALGEHPGLIPPCRRNGGNGGWGRNSRGKQGGGETYSPEIPLEVDFANQEEGTGFQSREARYERSANSTRRTDPPRKIPDAFGILKSVFWSAARQKGVGRERRKYRAAPVAKKRVEVNRWHGFPLWAVNEGGTVPAPSRAAGEWLEGR